MLKLKQAASMPVHFIAFMLRIYYPCHPLNSSFYFRLSVILQMIFLPLLSLLQNRLGLADNNKYYELAVYRKSC